MATIDSVQQYLDGIYPATSTEVGIAVRLGLTTAEVLAAVRWLIAQRRAVAVEPDASAPGVVQYQSTAALRATSRNFNGSVDS